MIGVEFLGAHGSESDCFALMRITALYYEAFVNYISVNYRKLSEITPMWTMKA